MNMHCEREIPRMLRFVHSVSWLVVGGNETDAHILIDLSDMSPTKTKANAAAPQ